MRLEIVEGQRIDSTRLTYIRDTDRTNPRRRRALFMCDCGEVTNADLNYVRFLNITSCGCYKRDIVAERNTKHSNAVRGKHSGAYRSWSALSQRVKVNPNYNHIEVCDRWKGTEGFKNFLEDLGERPAGKTIERNDNSKGYEPSNCRWATQLEQAQNTSHVVNVEIKGETHSISEWCRIMGITYRLVKQRRAKGTSLVDAITTPIDKSKQRKKHE